MSQVFIDGVEYIPAPQERAASTMVEHEAAVLRNQISKSSLTYAMVDYSNYDYGRTLIEDRRFHQLRNAFVKAHAELQAYIDEQMAKHGLEID